FLDVASNAGFLIAGLLGLYVALRPGTRFVSDRERWPYALFFVGVLLTAWGSSYYHLAPDNERLFWDRLPMTVAFMSLIAAQVADRVSVRAGLRLLIPLLLIGAASVIYWRMTERAGSGNLVPYALLQGYCVVVLLVIAALFRSRYTHANAIYSVFAGYVVAKVCESFDHTLFAATGLVSGHTLKHLAAAVASLIVCWMLWRRAPVAAPPPSSTVTG
ncbi:MAG TPA: hypothetical protein VH542_07745, partial [Steroidobacteraceae bacterium]